MTEWTKEQKKVFGFVQDEDAGNGIVSAVAGSGKSTTLAKAIEYAEGSCGYLVFNTKLAQEAKEKIDPDLARVNTFHSLGFGALRYRSDIDYKLEHNKMYQLANELSIPDEMRSFSIAAANFARNEAFGITTDLENTKGWLKLVDHYGLESELPDLEEAKKLFPDSTEANEALRATLYGHGIAYAVSLIENCIETAEDGWIDFTDQIYMSLYLNRSFYKQDWLFCDEIQDVSRLRRMMLKRALKPNGRILCVGDRSQSIMAFSGSLPDAMDKVKKQFDCTEMHLTYSFRCGRAISEYARQWSPEIQSWSGTSDGKVSEIQEKNWNYHDLKDSDAVLCRNTKPLISMALNLIRQGIRCHVEGRDIGRGLITFCKKWKSLSTVGELREKLKEYLGIQVKRLLEKHKEAEADSITDKIESVFVIAESFDDSTALRHLEVKIESLFKDGERTLTLSTIHKSKGREWDRVFWLGKDIFNPSPYARKPFEKEQELNLCYVAATRARHELCIINMRPPKPPERTTGYVCSRVGERVEDFLPPEPANPDVFNRNVVMEKKGYSIAPRQLEDQPLKVDEEGWIDVD